MIKSFSFFVLGLALLLTATASPAAVLHDLGEGLAYVRIHDLDPTAPGLATALNELDYLILDLRHATATAEAAGQLRTALNNRRTRPPVFILVGPATPPAVAEALTPATGRFVTLGIQSARPAPQVVVEQSADADQRAYDALEKGRTLASLTSGQIVKDRFDEATLMKEFREGDTNAAPPPEPDPTARKNGADKAGATANAAERLIDRVLQRAINLHRALLALKKRLPA